MALSDKSNGNEELESGKERPSSVESGKLQQDSTELGFGRDRAQRSAELSGLYESQNKVGKLQLSENSTAKSGTMTDAGDKLTESESRQSLKDKPAVTRKLERLDNRAADHKTPDAVVHIKAGFDPSQPVKLAIFNHGWWNNADSAFKEFNLAEQMKEAPPNTVLIVPEWQKVAGAESGEQGKFAEKNRFRNMLQEIFDKTPELRGKTLNDVSEINIFSHSAGYNATGSELYNNGLGDKIKSITLLDSLYDPSQFDSWIKENIMELDKGTKQFYAIFNGDQKTQKYNKDLAERVKSMLKDAGLDDSQVLTDYDKPKELLGAESFERYPMVFKFSTHKIGKIDPHFVIPMTYIDRVQQAAARRSDGDR